jgi:tryptophan-rich sensory protein
MITSWPQLIAFVVICELVGIAGSVFTVKAIPNWYAKLRKPSFRPPNWVFGPVWTLLYAFMGWAAYLVYSQQGFKTALIFFTIQLVLNAIWTPLFFGAKKLGWAFGEIVIMWIFILLSTIWFFGVSPLAGWLLLPYLAWVSFASALNFSIWQLNK